MADRVGAIETPRSLLILIRNPGDCKSWTTFVAIYGPLIRSFARERGLQEADVDDVAQVVLSTVARVMPTFEYRPERGRFCAWLGTVTRNAMRKHVNRTRRQGQAIGGNDGPDLDSLVDSEPDPDWSARFQSHVLRVACERIRSSFETATWTAFTRTWLDDTPAVTVADELGLPIHAVYVAKSRVLKGLREEVLLLADDAL